MTGAFRNRLPFPLSELSAGLVFATLVLTLMHIGTQVALPWVLGDVVDNALISRNRRELDRLILILIGLAAVAAAARGCSTLTRVRAAELGILRIKRRFVSAVLQAPLPLSECETAGAYQAMVVNDGTKVRRFITSALPETLYALLQLIVLSAVILIRFPQACWVAALLAPAYALVPGLLTPRLRACSHVVQRSESDESVINAEVFAGVRDIKALSTTAWARRRARAAAHAAAAARSHLARWQSLLAIDYFVYWIIVGSIYLIGGRQVVQGSMSVGELIALVAYLSYLQGPLWRLIESYNEWQKLSPSLDKLQSVLSLPPEARPGRAPAGRVPTEPALLVLNEVSYRYPGADNAAVDSVSLTLRRGEMVCLSGPSGAGKTTVLKLLIRLLEADSGWIELEGRTIASWPLPLLRRRVSVLFENAPVWSCSILDNIVEGRTSVDQSAVDRAMLRTRLGEFVQALPYGVRTQLSNGGMQLSAGQRQRIRLARTMARTPARILALDEPTVHLDPDLCDAMMRSLRTTAHAGACVLVVSHDSQIASSCDRQITLGSAILKSPEPIYAN